MNGFFNPILKGIEAESDAIVVWKCELCSRKWATICLKGYKPVHFAMASRNACGCHPGEYNVLGAVEVEEGLMVVIHERQER